MRFLDATIREIDVRAMQKKSATEADCSHLVTEDCTVRVGGVPKIIYISRVQDPAVDRAREAVQRIKCDPNTRTNGLVTKSKIFGYAPRNVLRNAPCRAVIMAVEYPSEHNSICAAASTIDAYYRQHFPEVHDRHKEITSRVREQWMIPGSVFTSGIVNHNNPLQYHFDAGNFPQVCSAMLGFRHKTTGGHLSCPELDIAFEIGDKSLIMFDGQSLLHGVTPIKRHGVDSFRYTVVYYSLKQMWNCDTVRGEVDNLRNRRSITERRKAEQGNRGYDSRANAKRKTQG